MTANEIADAPRLAHSDYPMSVEAMVVSISAGLATRNRDRVAQAQALYQEHGLGARADSVAMQHTSSAAGRSTPNAPASNAECRSAGLRLCVADHAAEPHADGFGGPGSWK